MKKIIIFGFPHCGTTILRAIIGHIDDVHEIVDETDSICIHSAKKYVLCKCPKTKAKFFSDRYANYIKICIIRNPYFVFSSLNKRFSYEIRKAESLEAYAETCKMLIQYKQKNIPNLYFIRYEDLFEYNYSNLRNIFDKIGFQYTDKIFDNTQFKNQSHESLKTIPSHLPTGKEGIEHRKLRTFQINQPFVNNNDPTKINLTDAQINFIKNDPYILKVYPEIAVETNVNCEALKKCNRKNCNYMKHTNALNNGGTHCCKACLLNKGHGVKCAKATYL